MAERELIAVKRAKAELLAMQKRADFEKYAEVFDAVHDFLKGKSDVLIYGGQALDDLLPDRAKIYDKYTLPDTDILSYNAAALAKKLVANLNKLGYKYEHITDAIHENTYKVYCEGLQVADITHIPKSVFKSLQSGAVTRSLGVPINPTFLRSELHHTLAMPRSSDRWDDTFERLIKFYRQFPPRAARLSTVKSLDLDNIHRITADCIHMGTREVAQILGQHGSIASTLPQVIALVPGGNLADFAERFPRHLRVSRQKIMFAVENVQFITVHEGKQCLGIFFDSKHCYSYVQADGRNIATAHTIAAHFLRIILSPTKFFAPMRADFEACVEALTHLQYHALGSRRKLLEVQTLCLGADAGIVTMRRHRIQRRGQK
jgi:hypothetical protein